MYLGDAFRALAPGVTKGAKKKKRKKERGRDTDREVKEGKEKERRKIRGKKAKDTKVNQHDGRGTIQAQAGAPGKKTSGVLNRWELGGNILQLCSRMPK